MDGPINEKKQILIERYENLLDFLKAVDIKNEEDLNYIKKPLDELESNLKYIPNGPFFNDVIPTELKVNILSSLCNSNSFLASCVCQEWKKILGHKFIEKDVIIGEDCSKCENSECARHKDMLKAVLDHKLDVHLRICKPVTQIEKELVTDALTSVSKFTVTNNSDYDNGDVPILSLDQLKHLFASTEKGDKIMKEVKLEDLDLNGVNQERLASCLINKIEKLTLDYVDLNVSTFVTKLQQGSANMKLTQLTICEPDFYEYPSDLKILFNKMATFQVDGLFTWEQLESVKSLHDVEIVHFQIENTDECFQSVRKGLSRMYCLDNFVMDESDSENVNDASVDENRDTDDGEEKGDIEDFDDDSDTDKEEEVVEDLA